jgi:hypothetical protein
VSDTGRGSRGRAGSGEEVARRVGSGSWGATMASNGTRASVEPARWVLPRHGAERCRGAAVSGRFRPAPVPDPPRRRDSTVRPTSRGLVPDDDPPPRRRGRPDGAALTRDAVAPRPLRARAQCAAPTLRRPLRRTLLGSRDPGREAPRRRDRVRAEQPRSRRARRALAGLAVVWRHTPNRTLVRSFRHG